MSLSASMARNVMVRVPSGQIQASPVPSRQSSPSASSYRNFAPSVLAGSPGVRSGLSASVPSGSCRVEKATRRAIGSPARMEMPLTYASPPITAETLELVTPQKQQVVEFFGQPPVTYVASPGTMARPGPYVETVEVIRGPGGVQEIVEVVRDDAEIISLRTGLEEKAILVAEYQRRNIELQAQTAEYQRFLGDAEGQISQLRLEKGQLETLLRDKDTKLEDQKNEIQMHVARNEELLNIINEQAQRIVVLDKFVVDLEHEKSELEKKNHQLEQKNHELEKKNHELEKKNHELEQKIKELEETIKQLRSGSPQKEAPPPPPEDNLSDDDLIDHRLKEFFRNHDDFQVSIHKERAGLYSFAKPINKKVSMKVVGTQVLARVGGGWEEVWSWLSQERQAHLEAEGIEDKTEKEGRRRSANFSRTHSSSALRNSGSGAR